MNIVQFTPAIGKTSGKEMVMRRVSKELNAKVYTLTDDNRSASSDKLPSGYEQFMDSVNSVRSLSVDIPELSRADLIIGHSAMSPEILSDIDTPILLMNHGGFKELTTIFNEVVELVDDTHEFSIRQDIGMIRNEIGNILSKADIVTVMTEYRMKQFQDYFSIDTELLYNPIDYQYFTGSSETESHYIWIGRNHWIKRPEVVLKAFEELDSHLVFIGSKNEYCGPVKRYCKSKSNITYLHNIEKSRLKNLLTTAKGLIHTSYDETCPCVIREAMACGTPTISIDAEVNKEIMNGTGVIFGSDSPEKNLAQTVSNFDEDEHSESRLREIGSKYSMESFNENLERLVRNS